MIYAQIKDGTIKNTIVLDDLSKKDLFKEGFDHLVRIDDVSPQPGIGWSYNEDDSSFTAPPPQPDDLEGA